jgi:transcriptional regulator with XRE-family HTH domain
MKGNIDPLYLQELRIDIGTWLRDLRKAKGYSQAELAERMQVRQQTVSKVEGGEWAITIDMLALFCLHLDYPIKKLFQHDKVPVRPGSRK